MLWRNWFCATVAVSCLMVMLLLTGSSQWQFNTLAKWTALSPVPPPVPARECPDVLSHMLRGQWVQHNMTNEEKGKMRQFYYKKPKQFPGRQCGNLNNGHMWTRALCDEESDTPCCFNNVCVNKTASQCTCNACYDQRRTIIAEQATWRPVMTSCAPLLKMSAKEMCGLLNDSRLVLIGDSLMRHVFTALLMVVRDDVRAACKKDAAPDKRAKCSGEYMFEDKQCRSCLDKGTLCNGTVHVSYAANYKTVHRDGIIRTVISTAKRHRRSLVFFGMGAHERFNVEKVESLVLRPLLDKMRSQNLPRHKLLWASHKAPGLLKPDNTTQSYDRVVEFNREVNRLMHEYHVPIFDMFNLTDGVRSFDGMHYALGVNRLIVQVLFNYLWELNFLNLW